MAKRDKQKEFEKRRLRAELVRALKQGAMAHGFPTELWTLPRVGRLIEVRFGLRYSEPHVWRILRQLGFSPQRPSKRALERDADAIREWKRKRWPTLKKRDKTRTNHRLRRRVGTERATDPNANVGPAR